MVFLPDPKFGRLGDVPDNIPISEFMLNEQYGRLAHSSSRDPYTCGITGRTYTSRQVVDRVDHISRGLAKEFNWAPNKGTEWDKTIAVFSLNTVGQANKKVLTHQILSNEHFYSRRLIRCLLPGLYID